VLPTFYREGIPRVLLEAASMGLPIVTTDTPGCNQVVEDGVNGFLIPTRDADALAQAITRLAADPGLRKRFGIESRRRAVSRFDLSVIAAQTRSVYRELLERKGMIR
jgi:glycosyltransferase involved in cell wall biosynthesis